MRAVDTNVLVRMVARDDAKQADSADSFVRQGAWVSLVAQVEATWVLRRTYGFNPARLAAAIELLLNHTDLAFQDADAVASALTLFRQRPSLGFSDCLMVALARKAGHLPLCTFERTLGRLD